MGNGADGVKRRKTSPQRSLTIKGQWCLTPLSIKKPTSWFPIRSVFLLKWRRGRENQAELTVRAAGSPAYPGICEQRNRKTAFLWSSAKQRPLQLCSLVFNKNTIALPF
jgi:hypothetical protein